MTVEGKQLKAYLRAGDDDLFDTLRQYAKSGTQGDVIRLALYRLFDMAAPGDLHVLDSLFQSDSEEAQPVLLEALQAIADNTAAVRDMAEAVTSGQTARQRDPPRPRSLPETPETERSSGLDMSRPRTDAADANSGLDMSRPRPAARRAPVSVPIVSEADEVTDADLIALGQLMARSIKNAQPGRQV
jgi:hypothetical protein